MTLRCRKGDMAIVLESSSIHYGKICSVDEWRGSGAEHGLPYDDLWDVSYDGEFFSPITLNKWVARDSLLLPIRPDDLDETEETEKELAA